MKQYVGTDIIEIARINDAIEKFGETFLERIYTHDELTYFRAKPPSLAARFAGKEAIFKALDLDAINFHEIEILSDAKGRPVINLYGKTKSHADAIGIQALDVSLSHSKEYAVACAICQ